MFAAMHRASSRVSSFAADGLPDPIIVDICVSGHIPRADGVS
jgi:hypothetical protein